MTVCHTWKMVYIPLLLLNSKSSVANTDNTALEWPSAICVHVTGAGLPLVIVILLLFGLGTMFPLKHKQIYIIIPCNTNILQSPATQIYITIPCNTNIYYNPLQHKQISITIPWNTNKYILQSPATQISITIPCNTNIYYNPLQHK